MNLRYTTLAVCFTFSAGWQQVPASMKSPTLNKQFLPVQSSRSFRPLDQVRLKATVVPEEDVERKSALSQRGKPIGEGTIVSCLPGGLVAVKVDDSIDLSMRSPEVEDLTNELPKEEQQKPQSPLGMISAC